MSSPGYYKYRNRPMSPTRMRRQWLTGLIREVHTASRGTYGSRRIQAELTRGMDVRVSEHLVAADEPGRNCRPSRAGQGQTPARHRHSRCLVNRKFHRPSPNELWVTDITEHPTREGKVYCCAVMDTFSRRIVGWSIDTSQDSALVVNALDMTIRNRRPVPGGIVHADSETVRTGIPGRSLTRTVMDATGCWCRVRPGVLDSHSDRQLLSFPGSVSPRAYPVRRYASPPE
ncbi:putative transposase for insertion sequence element IS986/IS6110 [Arthrobacter sp. Hiyo6]|nr:putative transposase for insertion sequence element IS986/IS6110 [Arthrobacter sp. Hiyo6]